MWICPYVVALERLTAFPVLLHWGRSQVGFAWFVAKLPTGALLLLLAQGLWPCAHCTKTLRVLVLREHSPVLPTGAPVNATVAQQVCCFAAHLLCSMRQKPTAFGAKEQSPYGALRRRTGPLALCSMHQKCFALLVLRSKAPTGLCDVRSHTGPLALCAHSLRSSQVCCFAAHLLLLHQKGAYGTFLVLRSIAQKPTAFAQCDVAQVWET